MIGGRHRFWLWQAPAWTAITVVTVFAAHGVAARIWTGVAMVIAVVAVQFTDDDRSVRVRMAGVVIATVAGLVAVVTGPSGLAEVPVFLAASRVAITIDHGWGRWFVIADMIAVGAVIGFVSRSLVGVLAGLAIPLLAQRAVERRELIASRDEAQALLVEVQAGREAEAEAAALQERGRIARDLHDVLAHSLAGLSVQLQATRAVAAREQVDAAVLEPLDKAAALARGGLAEARAVVSALRDPVGLGIAELPALVERHPGQVSLQVSGTAQPVAPEAGHAVYRAVQEALTNAARYAPGAPVTVALSYAESGLDVCVCDAGLPPGRSAVASQGSGLGLAGMDERIRSVGGTLTAGPRAEGGGWQVEVRVPVLAGSPA
jgi:signal transduction histidine kinase